MAAIIAKVKDWNDPTVLGGDTNSRGPVEAQAIAAGWASARKSAVEKINANYRTTGTFKVGEPIDFVLTRKLIVRSYRVLRGWDPATKKSASDHHIVVFGLDK